jgi:choline dehydrogenase-like flavoprotein
MGGVALFGEGDTGEMLDKGRALSLQLRVEIPDLQRFEARNNTLATIVAGEVSWDGVLDRAPLVRKGQIRLIRDGRIAGISKVSFKVDTIEPDGRRLTFTVRRTLDPLGHAYDSTVEIRRCGEKWATGLIFDPPRAYDQHITDIEVEGGDPRGRKRARKRFLKAIRSAPRRSTVTSEISDLVATLLASLHVQEDGGPTLYDVHSQYMLMLDRVPAWRHQTIVDFLRSNIGAVRFLRDATRILIRDPVSRLVNTGGLDAAHNLYQFLYYTLQRSNGLIGHAPMALEGGGRRPRLRRPPVATLADLDLRRTDDGWVLDGFDVVIIGSGPAGSLLAERLGSHKKVLVLEKGPAFAEGEHRGAENAEFEAYTRLYEGAGLQAANDDWGELNKQHGSIFVLQGSCAGGGGMINNSIFVRMADARIKRWIKGGFPLDELPDISGGRGPVASLHAAYAVVAHDLGIVPLRDALASRAPRNPISDRLGSWEPDPEIAPSPNARRRTDKDEFAELLLAKSECLGCGFCNVGCAYGAKRSAYEVYLRRSLEDPTKDVTLVARAEVVEIKLNSVGDAVEHLVVEMPHTGEASTGTRTVLVRAKEYILSAGAVGSSVLLLKSPDIRRAEVSASIGTRFTANLAVPLIAVYKDDDMAAAPRGLQMTHSFVPAGGEDENGYVIETWFSEPGGFALGVPGYFGTHRSHMKRYRSSSAAVVLVGTDPALGSIHWYEPGTPEWNHPKLAEYQIRRDRRRGTHLHARPFIILETRQKDDRGRLTEPARKLRDSFRNGLRRLAKQILDGADGRLLHILVPSRHGWKIRTPADIDLILGAEADLDDDRSLLWPGSLRDIRYLRMTTAHPQGGNPLQRTGGAVGSDFRLRGVGNLRVCDSSIFPDNAGVNPQWTVLALAHLCSVQMTRESRRGTPHR